MAVKTALGIQDFGKIIEDNCFYVDKTHFIKEWWENGDAVTLITRPRRFGKTLAMSMMDYFFSIRHPGRSDLFEGLSIWKEPAYRKLQGTWPVIFLSFAAVKGNRFETAREMLCQQIVNLYTDSRFLLEEGFLAGEDAAFFQRISVTMNDAAAFITRGRSRTGRKGRKEYFLDIVNLEVRVMFENLFSGWFGPCRRRAFTMALSLA